jgi:hypothetical protein
MYKILTRLLFSSRVKKKTTSPWALEDQTDSEGPAPPSGAADSSSGVTSASHETQRVFQTPDFHPRPATNTPAAAVSSSLRSNESIPGQRKLRLADSRERERSSSPAKVSASPKSEHAEQPASSISPLPRLRTTRKSPREGDRGNPPDQLAFNPQPTTRRKKTPTETMDRASTESRDVFSL